MTPEQLRHLTAEGERLAPLHLRDLLRQPGRYAAHSHRVGPLLLDQSKQKWDAQALDRLGELVNACGWEAARDGMFRGDVINRSEQRAVLHTALRAIESRLPSPAPADVRREIDDTLQRMAALVHAFELGTGEFGVPTGITDIVNLGIGGSDLGPRLAVEALTEFHSGRYRSHFLPNEDRPPIAA